MKRISGGIEVNWFAHVCLILEAKFGDDLQDIEQMGQSIQEWTK